MISLPSRVSLFSPLNNVSLFFLRTTCHQALVPRSLYPSWHSSKHWKGRNAAACMSTPLFEAACARIKELDEVERGGEGASAKSTRGQEQQGVQKEDGDDDVREGKNTGRKAKQKQQKKD